MKSGRSLPQNTITDVTISKVCEEIRNEGALPILAYIDKKAGALLEMGAKNTPSKIAIFEEVGTAALEIVNVET